MIKLKEGQKIIDINNNEYLIEKNDCISSLQESEEYYVVDHLGYQWEGPIDSKTKAKRRAAYYAYSFPNTDFSVTDKNQKNNAKK